MSHLMLLFLLGFRHLKFHLHPILQKVWFLLYQLLKKSFFLLLFCELYFKFFVVLNYSSDLLIEWWVLKVLGIILI